MPLYLYNLNDDGSEIPVSEGIYFCDKNKKVYALSEAPWPSFPPARIDYWISQMANGHADATKSKKPFGHTKKLWNRDNPKVKEHQLLEPVLLRYGLEKNVSTKDNIRTDVFVQLSLPAFVKLILCHKIEEIWCIIKDGFENDIDSFLLCCEGASEGYKIPSAVSGHIIKIFQDHTHGRPEVFIAKCNAFTSDLAAIESKQPVPWIQHLQECPEGPTQKRKRLRHDNSTNADGDNGNQRKRPRQDDSANIDGDTDDPHISNSASIDTSRSIEDAQCQTTPRNPNALVAEVENPRLSSDQLATAVVQSSDLVLGGERSVVNENIPVEMPRPAPGDMPRSKSDIPRFKLSSKNVAGFIMNYDSRSDPPFKGGVLEYRNGEAKAVVKFPKHRAGDYGIEVNFGIADWQKCLQKV